MGLAHLLLSAAEALGVRSQRGQWWLPRLGGVGRLVTIIVIVINITLHVRLQPAPAGERDEIAAVGFDVDRHGPYRGQRMQRGAHTIDGPIQYEPQVVRRQRLAAAGKRDEDAVGIGERHDVAW